MKITRSLGIRTRIILTSGLSSLSLLIAYFAMSGIISLPFAAQSHAITPPDSCFAFDSATGKISEYYYNESNDPVNPTCPRAVDIPATIGGVGVLVIGDYAFAQRSLTSVTIPSGVLHIGQHAFVNNSLSSVVIPDGVSSIGPNAFMRNQLSSVTFPATVTTLSHDSFINNPISSMTVGSTTLTEQTPTVSNSCFAMSGSTVTDYYQASPIVARDNGILCGRNVAIQNGVTSIGDYAFSSNQLTSVTIPSTVASIGDFAFNANRLTSVSVPSGVMSIGFAAFMMNDLTNVDLSAGLVNIGMSAFQMNKISSVTIPASVTSLGAYAFATNQLTSVVIPGGIAILDGSVFAMNQLTSVTISSGVTRINSAAFSANRLTSVLIPDSVTNIDRTAFSMQNKWGGSVYRFDCDTGDQGAPCIYRDSVDASEIQRLYDTIWYARLYTADPANPNSLQDGVLTELDGRGGDANANGKVDSLGGHLINPVAITLKFTNNDGVELRPGETYAGKLADGTVLSNYLVSNSPATPLPEDPWDVTPAEQAAIDAALAVYYRIGDTFTYTAPLINGITPTPASYSFVLGASTQVNTKTFVYGTAAPVSTTSGTGGSLANTGMNVTLLLSIAGGMIVLGAVMVWMRMIAATRR